ncbi:replication initiation protein [Phyllobacterium brassicacearum]|uniref:Replication initiation protein n=1 Tax=Phyllobacterium brassicacearum TaxID=314235 RepID=A0A2P7BQP5_9HYPH|nr:plasmid replication protein RepC [Phyllobacterium brassicacearum]PSH68793.1 replication initiation protein [Phyllobacterium brassicacearum]TDQ33523.1 replication initiation protein RepC [Phyllobacterium brassicacearum]
MQTGNALTTPFGRRAMSLGMLATQALAQEVDPEASIDKWKLFRSICEARVLIGVSDRALVVLNALLTFYPQAELNEANGLVVFPSNAQLSLRAHGMAPATLRRHLSALVEAGLIFRKDSPNGKRYARRSRGGEGGEAFGFSLSPLVVQAAEIDAMAERVRKERLQLKLMKERVTLLRRDIVKLIELGFEELPETDWSAHYARFRAVIDGIARQATIDDLEPAVDGLECIHLEISNLLENKLNSQKTSAKESHSERHKQNSNTQSTTELEPSFPESQGSKVEQALEAKSGGNPTDEPITTTRTISAVLQDASATSPETVKPVPLGLVCQACPEIAAYAKHGIGSWSDLMAAAVVVRSMLGVSPSAYEEACDILGQENAAIVMACILERAQQINSAGGYLRSLTDKAARGEFSVWPMVLAQLRANGTHVRLVTKR